MSKLYKAILAIILILLVFKGLSLFEWVIRVRPLLPFYSLFSCLVLAFLFYKVPKFLGKKYLGTILFGLLIVSIFSALLADYNKSRIIAYLERTLFEGKISHKIVEVGTDQGDKLDTVYQVDGIDSTLDTIITITVHVLMFVVPVLVYRIQKRVPFSFNFPVSHKD